MARISATRFLVVGLVMLASGRAAWADFVTYTGTDGGVRSASVTFTTSGTNLLVTLTNTSTFDVVQPDQVLTAVFFSGPALTPVTAIVPAGSNSYLDGALLGATDVSSEWAYRSNLAGTQNSGISSSGLSPLFGGPDRFDTVGNLDGPDSPNGIGYGITSAGDVAGGNGGIDGRPLTQNSVVFTLSGWTGSLSQIGNVFFQYGTEMDEPSFPGNTPTPEPATMLLMGLGVAGLAWYRKQGVRA